MSQDLKRPSTYGVGTLVYRRKDLFWLFAWLLMGDFTLTLMEAVMPQLLPLTLRDIGASNILIGIIVGSLPTVMNVVLNPFISTASDRFRSSWGRRIPFLMVATPFITLFLILLGYSVEIGAWVSGTSVCRYFEIEASHVTLFIICLFVVFYQFFNLFVASVYYYLFADVVPAPLMGRFLGILRLVSQLALFVWGRYIFGFAGTHMREIYVGIGLLYLVSFLIMCWRVKEGSYPAVLPRASGGRIAGWIKTYAKECFSHPFYLGLFLITAVCWFANSANTLFIFFCQDTLHLDLPAIGMINSWGTLVTIPLALIFGALVDKIHGLRMAFLGVITMGVGACGGFFLVHGTTSLLIYSLVYQAGFLAYNTAVMPMFISLFPKDRYGQFSSANAMISSLGIVFGNLLCGLFVDWIGDYRWLLAWQGVFFLLALVPLIVTYRGWIRLGGERNFRTPV